MPVRALGGGLAAITALAVNVNSGAYISAACDDGHWSFLVTATDAGGSQTDTVAQPCT